MGGRTPRWLSRNSQQSHAVYSSNTARLARTMIRIAGVVLLLGLLGIALAPIIAESTSLIAFASERDGNPQIYIMGTDGENIRLVTVHLLGNNFDPTWHPDGQRLALASWNGDTDIYAINVDGSHIQQLTHGRDDDGQTAWSPNGQSIAFCRRAWRNWDIYVMDADGSNLRNLTNDAAWNSSPTWSPDARQVAFASYSNGNTDIHAIDADGNSRRRLTDHPAQDDCPSWSPDSSQIAFASDRNGNWEIYVMDVGGSNLTRLTKHPATEWWPNWSSDGSQIAFTSDRDGDQEIYVMDADGSNLTRLTDHPADDWAPSWFDPAVAQPVTPTGKLVILWSHLKRP